MKQSKEEVDAVLQAAYHSGQHYRQRAKLLRLPPDPGKWLDEYEDGAASLSDELPQKSVILEHVRLARIRFEEKEIDEAKFFMLQIKENWQNAQHDAWVLRMGDGSKRGGAKGALTKGHERAMRVKEAKERYDKLSHMPKRYRKSRVAEQMGLPARTIREYLKNYRRN